MNWKNEHIRPKKGDTRERKGFLIFPKMIKGKIKWFKTVEWGEIYIIHSYILDSYWKSTHWID